MWMPPERVI